MFDSAHILATIKSLLPTLGNGGRLSPAAIGDLPGSVSAVTGIPGLDVPASGFASASNPYTAGAAGGQLAKLATSLIGKDGEDPMAKAMRRQRAAFRPQGAPPAPIGTPPFGRPPMPQQGAQPPPMSVGALLASPAGQQILKAMQAQMANGVSASG